MGCGGFGLALVFGLCANGDFGRVKPGLTAEWMHNWVGVEAANRSGVPASNFPLTDDEILLRDLAYPLIEPPYDRQRWYSILNEYGAPRALGEPWPVYDRRSYGATLFAALFDSPTGRYHRLNDDIRNDVVRIPPFCEVARRVADMDRKRTLSLGVVRGLTAEEAANAQSRVAENRLTTSWVRHSLRDRAEGYHYALERLVIATPSAFAVETERSLTLLRATIDGDCGFDVPRYFPGARIVTK